MIDPYEDLANAIVLLTAKDYRNALKKLMKYPRHESAKRTKAEVERFLRSDWYRELTSVDGDYMLKKIRSEVRET